MTEPILVTSPVAHVAQITLNRPDKRNALSTPVLASLVEAARNADADPDIRAIVITGGNKIFAAGADINEMAAKAMQEAWIDQRPQLWAKLRAVRTPLIAAVEGWCLGAGNELLLCVDLAVSSVRARFGQPETNLGIMPGAGGCAALAARVGRGLAMKMVLTGAPISAQEAFEAGLVTEICEEGKAVESAGELAAQIAGRAPLALQQAKSAINAAAEMPLTAALAYERQSFAALFATQDKKEGVDAFLEKRPPNWQSV